MARVWDRRCWKGGFALSLLCLRRAKFPLHKYGSLLVEPAPQRFCRYKAHRFSVVQCGVPNASPGLHSMAPSSEPSRAELLHACLVGSCWRRQPRSCPNPSPGSASYFDPSTACSQDIGLLVLLTLRCWYPAAPLTDFCPPAGSRPADQDHRGGTCGRARTQHGLGESALPPPLPGSGPRQKNRLHKSPAATVTYNLLGPLAQALCGMPKSQSLLGFLGSLC